MPLARTAAFTAVGAAWMVIIHRLNTGGYDHIGVTITTGILLGLLASFLDKFRWRRVNR